MGSLAASATYQTTFFITGVHFEGSSLTPSHSMMFW